jgi:hypothetical protein
MAHLSAILSGTALALALILSPAPGDLVLAQTGAPSADRGDAETQHRSPVVEGRRVQPRRDLGAEGTGQQTRRSHRAGEGPTGDPRLDAISRELLNDDHSPPPRPSSGGTR